MSASPQDLGTTSATDSAAVPGPVAHSVFPHAPDEISPEWLEAVLRDSGILGRNHIVSAEVMPTAAGFGAICTTTRVRLTYAQDADYAPKTLFAKVSTDSPMSVNSCEAEVRFYREIAPHLQIRVPRCYFAGSSKEHHLLLLEDVSDGYGGDSLVGCSMETATLLVKEIAGFHARWWERKILSEWQWLGPMPGIVSFLEQRFRNAWPRLRDRHRDVLSEYVVSTCDEAVTRVPEIFAVINGSPRTLMHGDLQLDNVRFGVNGDSFVLLDWGNVRTGSSVGDIAWFLSRSIPTAQRRSDGERLIREYHDALLQSGIVGFTLEDIYRRLKFGFVFLFLVLAHASVEADYSSERGSALHSAFVERGAAAIDDFRAGDVLR